MKQSIIYLYHKDRKQLKTFLTQTGSVVPLTSDPHARVKRGERGWRPIKISSWSVFLSKSN